MSALSITSLLPVYHRDYDSSILIIPILLMFMMLKTKYDKLSKIMIGLFLPIVCQLPDILLYHELTGAIPEYIVKSWLWKLFVYIPVYCLFIMSILLIYLVIINKKKEIRFDLKDI